MSESEAGRERSYRVLGVPHRVFLVYVAVTLLLTYPLGAKLSAQIPLGCGDIWQNLWNFWWWKGALLRLECPFWTDDLFHPEGSSLAFHTHSALNILVTLPFSLLFGIEVAYNLAILLGFVVAGWSAWLLVRYLTGEPRAAFIAGILYAFAPMHLEQSLEHLNLASIEFFPLWVYFLLRLLREGGWKLRFGAGLTLAANSLVSWGWGLIAAGLGLVIVLAEVGRGRRPIRPVLVDLVLFAVIASVLVAPFLWPMVREGLGPQGFPVKPFANRGVDPVFWFLPSDHHPILGYVTAPVYRSARSYPMAGFLSYIGWVPLGLACLALARRRWGGEGRFLWAGTMLVFAVLSLGSRLVLAGKDTGIPMPHALFENVPILRMLRVANRFGLWMQLPLAILAGFSLAAILRGGRRRLAWILCLLIVFEYLWIPYPIQQKPLPVDLGDPAPGAVLTIPFPVHSRYSQALYDQTFHERPMVGGYVSYPREASLRSILGDPFLKGLTETPPVVREPDVRHLRRMGVRTVVIRWDRTASAYRRRLEAEERRGDYYYWRALRPSLGFPDGAMQAVAEKLRASLKVIHRDESIEVFRVQ